MKDQQLYLGSAILNGPAGANDTPERFVPSPFDPQAGPPTPAALLIRAGSPDEARRKQAIWHALMARAHDLEYERQPVPQYAADKTEAVRFLRALADEIVGT